MALLEKLPLGTCPPFAFAVTLWMRPASVFVIWVLTDPFEDVFLDMLKSPLFNLIALGSDTEILFEKSTAVGSADGKIFPKHRLLRRSYTVRGLVRLAFFHAE